MPGKYGNSSEESIGGAESMTLGRGTRSSRYAGRIRPPMCCKARSEPEKNQSCKVLFLYKRHASVFATSSPPISVCPHGGTTCKTLIEARCHSFLLLGARFVLS